MRRSEELLVFLIVLLLQILMHAIELESSLVAVKKDLLLLYGLKGNVVFVFFLFIFSIVEVSLLMHVHRIDSTLLLYLL